MSKPRSAARPQGTWEPHRRDAPLEGVFENRRYTEDIFRCAKDDRIGRRNLFTKGQHNSGNGVFFGIGVKMRQRRHVFVDVEIRLMPVPFGKGLQDHDTGRLGAYAARDAENFQYSLHAAELRHLRRSRTAFSFVSAIAAIELLIAHVPAFVQTE